MALTRPSFTQLTTTITSFTDPITVLNQGASSPNVDVGFLFNRANGLVSNVALYWSESAQSFVTAYTGATGITNTNVTATSYANVRTGNITANGFFWSNGTVFSSGSTFTGGYVQNTIIAAANLVANSGTASSSNVTGALVVSGGIGVSGSINVGSNLVFSNGSNPGISKPLGVRMDLNNAGGLDANGPFWSGYHFNAPDGIVINGSTGYPRMSFYWNYNSATNPNNINFNMVAGNNATGGNANVSLGTDTAGYVRFLTNNAERLKIDGEGNVVATSTTTSTSTTTGALVVRGGTGIAGNLFAGGNLVVGTAPFNNTGLTGTPGIVVAAGYVMSTPSGSDSMWTRRQSAGLFQIQTFNGSNTGTLAVQPYGGQLTVGLGATTTSYTLDVSGTANVSSNITIGGNIISNSTTTSVSTSTGALVVAGGAGIAGALYIANTGDVSANIGAIVVTTIPGIQANLGTATTNITTLFSNAATQATSINSINANIGAYHQYANANLGTATTNITNLQSNAGAQQSQINSIVTNANANVAAYLPTYSGSLGPITTLTTTGAAVIGGNLNISGNLNVAGNVTTFNSNDLVIADSIIYIANDNSGDVLDIGFVGHFVNPGYQHNGLVRDASDGVWKLFANVVPEPSTTVDFTNATYSPLRIGALTSTSGTYSGAIIASTVSAGTIGNAGATLTGTLSFGAQNNITSATGITALGTITSLAATTAVATNFSSGNIVFTNATSGTVSTANVSLYKSVTATTTDATHYPILSGTATGNTASFTASGLVYNPSTGNLVLAGTTTSTSTTTGALVVAGGMGVAGTVNATTVSATTLTGTLSTAAQTNITSLGTLTGLTVNGITFTGNMSGTHLRVLESGGLMYIQAGNGVSGSGSTINFARYLTTTSALSVDLTNLRVGVSNATPSHNLSVTGTLYTSGVATLANIITTNGVYWANGAAYSSGGSFTGGYVASQSTFGANLVANSATNSTSNVTGAVVVAGAGGLGVGGNVYVGNRVGYVWGANSVSSAYTYFNSVTNSIDTVFG